MTLEKKVIITGAAGFIGFHLARALHDRGDSVLGYDNFNSYYSPQLKRARAELLSQNGVEIIEGDICNGPVLQSVVADYKPTHFVHLAAQAGVRLSLSQPDVYLKANVDGFLQVLETCRLQPCMKLIYASSSSVYGLNQKSPFSVVDRTDTQASFYGVTKKTNELMAQTYHHLYQIPVTGLRFFTVYGPWGRPDMAIYRFTKAIVEGDPIDVYNDGQMYRDFTYIDDIIDGTIAAIDLGSQCELFNLGNHSPVPLMELIENLEELLQKKALKNFLPMQAGDVLSTFADITHSAEKLKFRPTKPLKEGLSLFVDWFRSYTSTL